VASFYSTFTNVVYAHLVKLKLFFLAFKTSMIMMCEYRTRARSRLGSAQRWLMRLVITSASLTTPT